MTLTELIVATTVIGIVMLGVFAVDYAIRSTRSNAAKNNLVSLQAASALLEITQAVKNTTGQRWDGVSQQPLQEGLFASAASPITLCTRYDFDNEPSTFTGDRWKCFQQTATNEIYRCAVNSYLNLPCGTTTTNLLIKKPTATPFYIISRDATGSLNHVTITIDSRANPDQPENKMTNPQFILSADIYPPALSQ